MAAFSLAASGTHTRQVIEGGDMQICIRRWGQAMALLAAAWLAIGSGGALAQEKHKYHFKAPPGTTKFTQTHLLDAGDVPGHQLRIAEIQSRFPGEAPVYASLKVVESRGVLFSDYVQGSGNAITYTVSTLENGDKIYQRGTVMAHTSVGADGSRRTSFTNVTTLTGGTGKFKTIRGALRGTGFSDMKTGTSGTVTEGEYWFE
jgi:hypothetical protein